MGEDYAYDSSEDEDYTFDYAYDASEEHRESCLRFYSKVFKIAYAVTFTLLLICMFLVLLVGQRLIDHKCSCMKQGLGGPGYWDRTVPECQQEVCHHCCSCQFIKDQPGGGLMTECSKIERDSYESRGGLSRGKLYIQIVSLSTLFLFALQVLVAVMYGCLVTFDSSNFTTYKNVVLLAVVLPFMVIQALFAIIWLSHLLGGSVTLSRAKEAHAWMSFVILCLTTCGQLYSFYGVRGRIVPTRIYNLL